MVLACLVTRHQLSINYLRNQMSPKAIANVSSHRAVREFPDFNRTCISLWFPVIFRSCTPDQLARFGVNRNNLTGLERGTLAGFRWRGTAPFSCK
ncbi:MAG: hypothetical protein R3330_16325 [Saprospiraceae bacterium]|nr:hypothetical protein [Saprospiraceae bacterium]